MPNKQRAYGYPVLSPFSNDYIDGNFFDCEVIAKTSENDDDQISLEFKISLKSEFLEDILLAKEASVFLDLYCAQTMYRESVRLNSLDGCIELQPGRVFGSLRVEPVIVYTGNPSNLRFEGVHEEFGSKSFRIEPGSLLACGQTTKVNLRFKRTSLSGFIVVNTREDLDPNAYRIERSANSIFLQMGKNARTVRETLHSNSDQRPILSMSMYKDCFMVALESMRNLEVVEEHSWAQILQEKLEQLEIHINDYDNVDELNYAALRLLSSFGIAKLVAGSSS
jgi:hypothetical protein